MSVRAHRLIERVAQAQRALQRRAPQIVDAVAQARRLVGVRLLFDREGRRRRGVEQAQLAHRDLDLAGRQVRVHRLGRAPLDPAAHEDHVLGAQLARARVTLAARRPGGTRPARCRSRSAQVDEDHAAVVAAALHPAGEHDLAVRPARPSPRRTHACGADCPSRRSRREPCGTPPRHLAARRKTE